MRFFADLLMPIIGEPDDVDVLDEFDGAGEGRLSFCDPLKALINMPFDPSDLLLRALSADGEAVLPPGVDKEPNEIPCFRVAAGADAIRCECPNGMLRGGSLRPCVGRWSEPQERSCCGNPR